MLSKKLNDIVFPFFHTLAFKLTFSFTFVIVILSSVGFGTLYLCLQHYLNSKIDEELHGDFDELALIIRESNISEIQVLFDEETEHDDPFEIFYRLVNPNFNILAHTDLQDWSNTQLNELVSDLPATNIAIHTLLIRDDENTARVISGLLPSNQILQIGFLIDDEIELLSNFRLYCFIILVFMLMIACIVGQRISTLAVSGINNVTRTAEQITKGNMSKRVEVSNYGLELRNLGMTFNHMTDRIQTLIREMNELNDNIAHDLRIPITRMRGIAEETINKKETSEDCKLLCEDMIEECDNLLHITNTMLDISELDSGVTKMDMDSIGLQPIISQVTEAFQPVAEDHQLQLQCQFGSAIKINGDRRKLQRTFSNIIDNAIKYTPPGGSISIQVSNGNQRAKIQIRDTGIGISEAEQPKVFQRFFRCSKSRNKPGNGLGLCFAKSVINAHGGSINLESKEGKGTTFTITLPTLS